MYNMIRTTINHDPTSPHRWDPHTLWRAASGESMTALAAACRAVPFPRSTFSMKNSPAYNAPVSRVPAGSRQQRRAYLVRAADERAARDVEEAHVLCALAPRVELCGLDVAVDLHVLLRGAHVLPERDDVDVGRAELAERVVHPVLGLADAEHHARLRHAHARGLRRAEHGERLLKRRAPVAHERRHRLRRLDVVRVHVQPRARDALDMLEVPREVARERLDEDVGCPEHPSEMPMHNCDGSSLLLDL
jgi:hypothetical protein